MSKTTGICITFGEQSENHAGMEMHGNGLAEKGYDENDLTSVKKYFEALGATPVLTDLTTLNTDIELPSAHILYIENGVNHLCADNDVDLMQELETLEWDKKYWDTRRSKVLNKRARYNLCFGNIGHDADFEDGKGTVIPLSTTPILEDLKFGILDVLGEKDMEVEGNYYYDIKKTGIGWHGDSERKKVVGINLLKGVEEREIHWRWYNRSKIISDTFKLKLKSGDIYIMSEKASGWDWKKSSLYTLRHAAGCDKYLR